MKFSEKLIELRKQNGLSQEELGNKINVSRQAISKWESEQANPEVDKVKEISKVFNVSIEYLLNDEMDNPQAKEKVFNKNKKIKKIILIILFIFIAIYLLTFAYKFIVLLIYSTKAKNIADYDSYSINQYNVINNKILNEVTEYNEDFIYEDNIQVMQSYNYDDDIDVEFEDITYVNSNNRKAYSLVYDSEIKKYVYEDLTKVDINEDDFQSLFTPMTIKELTKQYIQTDFWLIIEAALNPRVKVVFTGGETLSIIHDFNGGYVEIIVNSITGIVSKYTSYTEDLIMITDFSYIFDDERFDNDYMIKEEFLEDIEYVVREEIEE